MTNRSFSPDDWSEFVKASCLVRQFLQTLEPYEADFPENYDYAELAPRFRSLSAFDWAIILAEGRSDTVAEFDLPGLLNLNETIVSHTAHGVAADWIIGICEENDMLRRLADDEKLDDSEALDRLLADLTTPEKIIDAGRTSLQKLYSRMYREFIIVQDYILAISEGVTPDKSKCPKPPLPRDGYWLPLFQKLRAEFDPPHRTARAIIRDFLGENRQDEFQAAERAAHRHRRFWRS